MVKRSYVKAIFRGGKRVALRVAVHLVQYHPYEHVLKIQCSELYGCFDLFYWLMTYVLGALMNYISATHAVSLFPQNMFVNRRSLVAKTAYVGSENDAEDDRRWLSRYNAQSGPIVTIWFAELCWNDTELGHRKMGDRHCWIVPLESTGMKYFLSDMESCTS